MTDDTERRGRARVSRTQSSDHVRTGFELTDADAAAQQDHFGVARDQIEHDFVISHVLTAVARLADQVVFYPTRAPTRGEWDDALGHQCKPEIDPDQAYEQVLEAWDRAVRQVTSA